MFSKKIYAGWGSSGMASITLFHKAALNTYLCQKLEWRTWKDWWAQIVGVEEYCGLKQLHPPEKSKKE
jgi:hypothetical protein